MYRGRGALGAHWSLENIKHVVADIMCGVVDILRESAHILCGLADILLGSANILRGLAVILHSLADICLANTHL